MRAILKDLKCVFVALLSFSPKSRKKPEFLTFFLIPEHFIKIWRKIYLNKKYFESNSYNELIFDGKLTSQIVIFTILTVIF